MSCIYVGSVGSETLQIIVLLASKKRSDRVMLVMTNQLGLEFEVTICDH